jgi:hypothetical protein
MVVTGTGTRLAALAAGTFTLFASGGAVAPVQALADVPAASTVTQALSSTTAAPAGTTVAAPDPAAASSPVTATVSRPVSSLTRVQTTSASSSRLVTARTVLAPRAIRRAPRLVAVHRAAKKATATRTAASTSTTSTSSPHPPLMDDFTSYTPGVWAAGRTVGPWQVVWNGYGAVSALSGGGLRLRPGAAASPGQTHSALVTSTKTFGDVDATYTYRTESQLRTGSAPNPWEVGWVLWHYTDNTHFYYVLLKPNGWELGKEDPAYPGAQRFLATGSQSFPAGHSYTIHVQQVGNRIDVTVDGASLVSFTDNERPYTKGSIGLYDEDSSVVFTRVQAATA